MSYSKTFAKSIIANANKRSNNKLSKNRFWLWLSIVWETLKLTRYQSCQFSLITFLEQRQKLTCWTWLCEQIIFIYSAKLFSTLKKPTFSISSRQTSTCKSPGSYSLPYSLPSLWKICKRISPLSTNWSGNVRTSARESHRHVRGSTRIYDVRVAQFALKIEKLSHIIGPRGF